MPNSAFCEECERVGNGKCRDCYGSGINVHLHSPSPRCSTCGGSGRCSICGGSGIANFSYITDGILPSWLIRAFKKLRAAF